MKREIQSSTRFMVRGALIAAAYTVLSYLSSPLTFMFFQFRLSEALCVLPIFMPEAVMGLFVGCIVSNYISGCVFFDILFGSIATLFGALGARLMRKLPERLLFLSTLPTVLANAIIIPFVIIFAYGGEEGYLFLFFTVLVGELVSATVLGSLLLGSFISRGFARGVKKASAEQRRESTESAKSKADKEQKQS